MVNLGEAYRKFIGKTVRATRTDRTMNEGKTKEERTNDEQMTNK